jgi:threonine/homoserine/homoserine lactone efflux protein
VNITNPKGIIFFAAIFPQFVDVARPQLVQYVILGATTFVTDLAIMMAYTALAAKVFRAMSEPAHLRWVNRALGLPLRRGWRRALRAGAAQPPASFPRRRESNHPPRSTP